MALAAIVSSIAAFGILPASGAAQDVSRADPAPAGGGDVLDAFLEEVTTLTADFEQQVWTADGELLESASGTLALHRPSRFRWHYSEPFEQLVVADGENLWTYDVELEQITVTPLDETVASSPAMLLGGDAAVREGFVIVETFAREGLDWMHLAPAIEGTDFRAVLIGFRGRSPRRLELVDGLNQVTRIELSNVSLNPQLDEEAFDFEPPAGADVIGTPG